MACTHTQVQRVSYGGLPLLISPSPTMAPCLSWGPRPSPVFPLQSHSNPQPIAHHSPACGALLLSPLSCLHTANPSPLPGTDHQSLSLSAQHLTQCLRLWCLGWGWRWCVQLSLCFALLSPAAAFFSATLRSLHLDWLFCQLGGFPGCGFLFFFIAPSQEC